MALEETDDAAVVSRSGDMMGELPCGTAVWRRPDVGGGRRCQGEGKHAGARCQGFQ